MALKYQDIEVLLRQADVHPQLRLIIQHLHAENSGLKQEIAGICKGLDVMIETMNKVLVVASAHNHLIKGAVDGKSFSESLAELRSEHLSGVESEEIKQ